MIGSLMRRSDATVEGAPVMPADIDFIAYAADCQLRGTLRLHTARLSDLLNRDPEISLVDVTATGLLGGPSIHLPKVTLWRENLYLVQLGGPRGDRRHKRSLVQVAVGLKVGPYLVRGHVHVEPGADAIAAFNRGRRMVPLTNAWVEVEDVGTSSRTAVPGLIVNRMLCDWVVLSPDTDDLVAQLRWRILTADQNRDTARPRRRAARPAPGPAIKLTRPLSRRLLAG